MKSAINSIISLTTDFGLNDEYVGVMKGVILSRAPKAKIVDLTHGMDNENLMETAFILDGAYHYFPKGTIHIAIVDPGVGSQRRIITLCADGHIFLGPDNGIFTLLARKENFESAREVTCSGFYCNPVSNTFHGRDIMAPIAAHLANGLSLEKIGPPLRLKDLVMLPIPEAEILPDQGKISGRIIGVDKFGNLITNIKSADLLNLITDKINEEITTTINNQVVLGLQDAYYSVPLKTPVLLIGSRNYLEIAVNCGRADDTFKAGPGDKVTINSNQA